MLICKYRKCKNKSLVLVTDAVKRLHSDFAAATVPAEDGGGVHDGHRPTAEKVKEWFSRRYHSSDKAGVIFWGLPGERFTLQKDFKEVSPVFHYFLPLNTKEGVKRLNAPRVTIIF